MNDAVTEVRPHDQALLIAVLKRSLDSVATQTLIEDVLVAAAATPRLPIVLDMSQVRFAPSVALGAIVQLNKGFKLDGRKLILIRVHPNVLSSMQVTNLNAVLETHETLDKAIQAQSQARPK
jgi:anti-anti-sigma factor